MHRSQAKHIADGMSVDALSKAAITYSDNGAMNQLLQILGGPQVVTSYARSLGDNKFNLVRTEPQLNTAIPMIYATLQPQRQWHITYKN